MVWSVVQVNGAVDAIAQRERHPAGDRHCPELALGEEGDPLPVRRERCAHHTFGFGDSLARKLIDLSNVKTLPTRWARRVRDASAVARDDEYSLILEDRLGRSDNETCDAIRDRPVGCRRLQIPDERCNRARRDHCRNSGVGTHLPTA
jgi:hypothetical protein